MKSALFFLFGLVIGIIATYWYLSIDTTKQPDSGLEGLTLFKEKGECIPTKKELKVFQVVATNAALAESGDYPDEITVLIINEEGKSYYDNQKIIIPSKMCARQVGTYQYQTRLGVHKTVPTVVIEN